MRPKSRDHVSVFSSPRDRCHGGIRSWKDSSTIRWFPARPSNYLCLCDRGTIRLAQRKAVDRDETPYVKPNITSQELLQNGPSNAYSNHPSQSRKGRPSKQVQLTYNTTPADTSKVVELLLETSKVVQAKEPYVSEYSCYREINFKDGLEDIVMFERLVILVLAVCGL